MSLWKRRSAAPAVAARVLTAVPDAFAAMLPSGPARADECVNAARRVSVSGCANGADAVSPTPRPLLRPRQKLTGALMSAGGSASVGASNTSPCLSDKGFRGNGSTRIRRCWPKPDSSPTNSQLLSGAGDVAARRVLTARGLCESLGWERNPIEQRLGSRRGDASARLQMPPHSDRGLVQAGEKYE
jgi:hypothetical protein